MRQPFFIFGPGRSGTTRLYHALKNHPAIALTNEARVADFLYFTSKLASLPEHDVEGFEFEVPVRLRGVIGSPYVEAFSALHAKHAMRMLEEFYEAQFPDRAFTHWGDKMPCAGGLFGMASLLEEVRVLFLVRDPRDFVSSSRAIASLPEYADKYPHWTHTVEEYASYWRDLYASAMSRLPSVHWIRYEDLVENGAKEVGGALDYLELSPHRSCLEALEKNEGFEGHRTSPSLQGSVGRFRDDLNAEEIEKIETVCKEGMIRFDYA